MISYVILASNVFYETTHQAAKQQQQCVSVGRQRAYLWSECEQPLSAGTFLSLPGEVAGHTGFRLVQLQNWRA